MGQQKKYLLICTLLLINIGLASGQSLNLLYNGNFEIHSGFPKTWGESYKLNYWKGINKGKWSPISYFYKSDDFIFSPLDKEGGTQPPYSGNGYIGIGIPINKKLKPGFQILLTELKIPLQKDSTYIITAFVSLADKAKKCINFIPFAFYSDLNVDELKNNRFERIKLFSRKEFIDDTKNWVETTCEYTANGTEKFFVIGDASDSIRMDPSLRIKKMPFLFSIYYISSKNFTYYFVDNLSILKKRQVVQATKTASIDSLVSTADRIILNDVLFKKNTIEFNADSCYQLDSIVAILKKRSNYFIRCYGYTDNEGSLSYNMTLSEKRAAFVSNYLKCKGIAPERIEYKGFGESNPIYPNNTKENKRKNRRVEIFIDYY